MGESWLERATGQSPGKLQGMVDAYIPNSTSRGQQWPDETHLSALEGSVTLGPKSPPGRLSGFCLGTKEVVIYHQFG